MRKKRMRWGSRKKSARLTNSEKRQQEKREAAEKFPKLQKQLAEIRARAQVLVKPYTMRDYKDELVALALKWKRAGRLDVRLKTLARLNGLASRSGANPYLPLVKGPLPDLERKRASKIAAEIKASVQSATKKD